MTSPPAPRRARATAVVFFIALASLAPRASAQATGSAEAAELFKQGRAALEQKDYATACLKLAESNRIERAVGTLISLAQCEEAQGKFAGARQHWQEAADLADAVQDRLARGAPAREKVAELDKKIGRLTVKAAPGAPASMTVKRDDVVLTSASFGSPLPVDVGKHVLVVNADGFEPRSYELTIAAGETSEMLIEPGPALPPPPPVVDVQPASPPALTTERDGSTMRVAGYVVGGVGIVGLGLGTVFGLRASSKWDDAQAACQPRACSPGSEAQSLKDSASTSGTLSTIAFVVGGAALAAGVTLLVLAPAKGRGSTTGTIRVVPAVGGLGLAGEL